MLEVVTDTEPLLRHGIVKHEVLHQVELRENSTRWSCESIAFQFSKICCSMLLEALASKSVMF